MPAAVIFDDGKGSLGPLTDLRASFQVRTGALTTLDRWRMALKAGPGIEVRGVIVPHAIAGVVAESIELPVNTGSLPKRGGVLAINGRCVVPPDELDRLAEGSALIAAGSASVIAAHLRPAEVESFFQSFILPPAIDVIETPNVPLLEKPWDVIRFRDAAMDFDLAALLGAPTQELPAGVIGIRDENIRISPEALIYPGVVLDAEHGPIIIADHATIRPGAVIIGPAFIGAGATVLDRALIKGHTSIGPVCKVAGEVGGTIFQGFANKAHDGHLGDSWVGEWANFGAGTTNSNLLNTYGEIVAQAAPDSRRERTGLSFLGCIVGDHVKFAILTRIMAGSVFGTGSMIAAANPPGAVGRFEWITEERRQPYRFEKFADVARVAMSRRKVVPSAAYLARLKSLAAPA